MREWADTNASNEIEEALTMLKMLVRASEELENACRESYGIIRTAPTPRRKRQHSYRSHPVQQNAMLRALYGMITSSQSYYFQRVGEQPVQEHLRRRSSKERYGRRSSRK
jgi:hypothetical protein